MMGEVLFRGKDIAGNWHYGVPLVFTEDYTCMTAPHTYNKSVIPATVGQFTGLTDENGKQIFEGDIVEPVLTGGTHNGFSWGKQLVVFDRGAFCLKDRRGEITPMCNYAANVQFKVWGNIHDNPELLEVTE